MRCFQLTRAPKVWDEVSRSWVFRAPAPTSTEKVAVNPSRSFFVPGKHIMHAHTIILHITIKDKSCTRTLFIFHSSNHQISYTYIFALWRECCAGRYRPIDLSAQRPASTKVFRAKKHAFINSRNTSAVPRAVDVELLSMFIDPFGKIRGRRCVQPRLARARCELVLMWGRYTRATALRQRKLAKASLQLAHVILLRCSCVVARLTLGVAGGKGGAIGRIFAIHDRPWVAGSHGEHIEGGGERWRKEGREEVRRQFKVLGPPSLE
jgi:hypothetical protein